MKETRICKICQQSKYIEDFKLTSVKNKNGIFYRETLCRICSNKRHKERNNHNGFTEKICSKCKINKSIEDFYKGRTECKDCHWKYKKLNRRKISLQKKQYYIQNKKYIQNREKQFYQNNKEKVKKRKKIYSDSHKKEFRKYYKRYKILNKEKINKYTRNYQKNRKKTDIQYKLSSSLRSSIIHAIKRKYKKCSTFKLLSCSIKQFKKYIESKFALGMTWENWGKGHDKWNLDHILPIKLFDLQDTNQQKICFHHTNFQPLWEIENETKSDFLPNGKKAGSLTREEKLNYLKSLGYNF